MHLTNWVRDKGGHVSRRCEAWRDAGIPAMQSSTRWPAANRRAHVLQLGDASYLARDVAMQVNAASLAASVRHFAMVNGFTHSIKNLSSAPWPPNGSEEVQCMYDAKVAEVHHRLHHVPAGDWVIYIDLDMQYACDDPRAEQASWFGERMPRLAHDGSECELIAQDERNVLNTGFLALRASRVGKALARQWWLVQRQLHVCERSADQHALQSAVLTHLGLDATRCDALARQHVADGRQGSSNYSLLFQSNRCYEAQLGRAGLPFENRSRRGICLLSPAAHRVQRYMAFESGDLFRHKLVSRDAHERCGQSDAYA